MEERVWRRECGGESVWRECEGESVEESVRRRECGGECIGESVE